jgi:intracellular sulfur oxidation DsrE/DsrF family protein
MNLDLRFAPYRLMVALCALVVAVACSVGAHAQSVQRNRIVIQVSDGEPTKWNLALNNVKNVQEDLGAKNVDIEIVAYGPGLGMLKVDSVVANKIADALASGVSVIACENTMKNQKLTRDDMLPKIGYVPAGVVQLMKRQQQGWAYIRP